MNESVVLPEAAQHREKEADVRTGVDELEGGWRDTRTTAEMVGEWKRGKDDSLAGMGVKETVNVTPPC